MRHTGQLSRDNGSGQRQSESQTKSQPEPWAVAQFGVAWLGLAKSERAHTGNERARTHVAWVAEQRMGGERSGWRE